METIVIIPSKGLGDLCVTLGLAYNLSKHYNVVIVHSLLKHISPFFPYASSLQRDELLVFLKNNLIKACVLIYEDSEFFQKTSSKLEEILKGKLFILNPVVTNKKDYQYSDVYFFNPRLSFSSNLLLFAQNKFLKDFEDKHSGFEASLNKDPHLIVIHATASKISKSWPKFYFLKLKQKLETQNYKVVFATLPHEIELIGKEFYSGIQSLNELAHVIAKAKIVIANESGIAHLASSLNTPSIVISRNPRIQGFWGADYQGKSYPIFAPNWIPNIKNFRLRDKYWKYLITPSKVLKTLKKYAPSF